MSKPTRTILSAVLTVALGGCAAHLQVNEKSYDFNLGGAKPVAAAPGPNTAPLLHAIFQDHEVLQRDKPIPVWGMTNPGARVNVTLAGETAGATADASGKWQAVLAPLKAGGPYELTAKNDAGQSQTIGDVLIGDVYLCSGQSNMEMPLRVASNYDADLYGATNTSIRLFHVERFTSPLPRETFGSGASWSVTSPASVKEFSAACYFFGRDLQPVVNVPVGLIEDSWGGSVIQNWISADKMRELGGATQLLDMLAVYAASPQAGEKKWREFADAWWLSHDPASAAVPAWHDPAYDDSAWDQIVPTGTWREWNVSQLKDFNGVVWLRETVTLNASQAQGAAGLSLGAIDQADTTWVNGIEVGGSEGYDVPRVYNIPAGGLHEGKNVIAVGVLGGSGMLVPADKMTLTFADGSIVRLTSPWRYKISAPVSETGHLPHIPWLYNGMIVPLGPTQLRGILWYQGESDAWQPKEYERQLPALIADWRTRFGAEVPFIIVQLTSFGPPSTKPKESQWAEVREVQRDVADKTPNAGLAVTIDIGQSDNIHPTNKQEVIYGENLVASSPTPLSAIRNGNTVAVRFADLAKGIAVYESNRPIGFQLCDKAKHCRFVDATVTKGQIELEASHVREAASVRFCWADSPICNVYNSEGLPAVPFEIPIVQAARIGKTLIRSPRHNSNRLGP